MDTLRLLSRGTRQRSSEKLVKQIPSSQPVRSKIFHDETQSRKRKRGETAFTRSQYDRDSDQEVEKPESQPAERVVQHSRTVRSLEERQALLKQHKIKVTKMKRHGSLDELETTHAKKKPKRFERIYPDPCLDFAEVAAKLSIPPWLRGNLHKHGYTETTEVQMAALPLQLHPEQTNVQDPQYSKIDLLTVAPTGSGKTLAFLVPLLAHLWRASNESTSDLAGLQALILAPTRELVEQTARVARQLSANSGFEVIQYRKGMQASDLGIMGKTCIMFSAPGVLKSAIDQTTLTHDDFRNVTEFILDEADVLLDPLFREQTVEVWNALRHQDLHVSLWSATMGTSVEDLARKIILDRCVGLGTSSESSSEARLPPDMVRLVVGLRDSAVPNVQHKLTYAATEQGKLMGIRQLIHPTTSSSDATSSLRPPFIVFTQTIERATALHSELLYDIPAEAGGIRRIAVLHSDMSDSARDNVMTRFRKAEIWILITTDLLSRGIDFRGVNGVVNYDIPSSSAAYVHRIGRTGRAGRNGGVAITFYTEEDIPYLKHVADVIAIAQRFSNQDDNDDVQQWLLDCLPSLDRNRKQRLKKYGVEIRTAHGAAKNPRAARSARITTKAGYLKQKENNLKGAIGANRRRRQRMQDMVDENDSSNSDFSGFGEPS